MQIYRTVNLINGKWYIGKDESDRDYYLGSGKALNNAINKYGKENFKKEILEECETRDELNNREIYWIDTTDAQNDSMSYNIGAGGLGGDWTSGFSDEEVKEIYKKRGNKSDNFEGATKWRESLSDEDLKEWYFNQAEKRTYDWYVSRLDDGIEILVHNLHTWCKENNIDSGEASRISNPNNKRYGGSTNGWRTRRVDQPELPLYINRRSEVTIKQNTIKFKGRRWKVVNGKRIWFDREAA